MPRRQFIFKLTPKVALIIQFNYREVMNLMENANDNEKRISMFKDKVQFKVNGPFVNQDLNRENVSS